MEKYKISMTALGLMWLMIKCNVQGDPDSFLPGRVVLGFWHGLLIHKSFRIPPIQKFSSPHFPPHYAMGGQRGGF